MRSALTSLALLIVLGGSAWAAEFKPTAQDKIVPKNAELKLLFDDGEFTEGPAPTGDGGILFSDIGNLILHYDEKTGKTSVYREPSGKANGLMFNAKGQLIACEGANGGNRRISITRGGKVETLADGFHGKRFNSPNDLAIDKRGNVYFTDPRYVGDEPRELDFEGVFLVQPDGMVKLATREVEKPNGILVSSDGKHVFVADNNPSGARQLLKFDVTTDGTLDGKQVLFDFEKGRGIDGMTLDREGNIYATAGRGDASGIYVFSPAGRHLALVRVPGPPTNCVFGVGETAGVLYITAQNPPPEEQGRPRRYGLYRIRLAAAGHHLWPR